MMTTHLKIDFVSDVSCPWCIVGLQGLELALEGLKDTVDADIVFRPFELNPAMPVEGQNIAEHVAQKYGSTAEESQASQKMIIARAAEVGFTMAMSGKSRIYNTFDAHRLLHWAELVGNQSELKHALFDANFTLNQNMSDHAVLVAAAIKAGLDGDEAAEVLASGRYAADVRDAVELWQSRGINSVPSIIINDKHLISGGQPVEVFERMLRQIANDG
jgi:predicted DsbA family dithiol-disulfide isomerase